jgi:hypothetical protein
MSDIDHSETASPKTIIEITFISMTSRGVIYYCFSDVHDKEIALAQVLNRLREIRENRIPARAQGELCLVGDLTPDPVYSETSESGTIHKYTVSLRTSSSVGSELLRSNANLYIPMH